MQVDEIILVKLLQIHTLREWNKRQSIIAVNMEIKINSLIGKVTSQTQESTQLLTAASVYLLWISNL